MQAASFVTSRHPLARAAGATVAALLVLVLVASPAVADVSFINSRRASAGLSPVSDHGGLAGVARSHAAEMASRGTLFHSANLAAKVGSVVTGWQGVGENVGVGESVAAVNTMFMQSATHRANILGNFNLAGVGVATGADGRVWVTQVFARVPAASAPRTSAPRAEIAAASAAGGSTAARPTAPRVSRSSVPRAAEVSAPAPAPPSAVTALGVADGGYRVIASDGGVFTFGEASFLGSATPLGIDEPVVGGAATPTGNGYVLFGARGGVFSFGDAGYHGSAADLALRAPIVGGAMTPTGAGYYLFAADGGALAFGDAEYRGGRGAETMNGGVVGGARTPTGRGYWLAGADGGVYAFGDAGFFGSAAELGDLAAPVVSMTATPTGRGYWLTAADGGVFAFGDAEFHGSAVGSPTPAPVRGMVPASDGGGYLLLLGDHHVIPYGIVEPQPRRVHGIASLRVL